MRYADCQRLFKSYKKRLVQKLLTSVADSRIMPTADDIQAVYGTLFETPSSPDISECTIGPIEEPPNEEKDKVY